MTKNAPNPTFKTDGLLLRFLQLMRFAMSGALNGCVAGIRPPLNSVVRWQSEVGIVMKDNSTQSWDRIADDWARHADTNDYRNLFLMPVTFELLGDVSGKNILDLGCGEGAYCRAFTKRGAYVTGIDGSERLINIAKARTDESITFLVRNANCLDGIEVDSFDIVLALMSLMDIEDYKGSISEVYRVLKPGRWVSMCYHDSNVSSWMKLQDLMLSIGFLPGEIESVSSMETGWLSLKMHTSTHITERDLVVNFRKPRPGELVAQLTLFGDEDAATFAEKARAILRQTLETHPGSTADRLYDELVSSMVRKGEFERHNFDQLLRSVAEDPRGDGRWYLLETADQADEAESAKEVAAAAHLESFMHAYLAEQPEESGVHYSDLFEQYLPVQDKPRRLMQEWLPEHFFRTPEGTWRPPAGQEERDQKEALRASGTLRRIKRFARALLEAVPPHDRDRPANTATAADWIRQCRRAGLHDLGRALYEKGAFAFDDLSEEAQLEVDEDYQLCVRRSG